MELKNYTPTELLKEINDIKTKHDSTKKNIVNLLSDIERIESEINEKVNHLNQLEENYVILIDELNSR